MAADEQNFDAKQIPWIRSPDFQTLYANVAAVANSTHDIQLRLGTTMAVEGKPAHIELATLFMSPSQAKATALLLMRVVLRYETNNNIELPIPEHLLKDVAAQMSRVGAVAPSAENVPPPQGPKKRKKGQSE